MKKRIGRSLLVSTLIALLSIVFHQSVLQSRVPDGLPARIKSVPTVSSIDNDEVTLRDVMGNPMLDLSRLPRGNRVSSEMLIGPGPNPDTTKDPKGSFRTQCFFSHFNYDDPIIFPGQENRSHLHVYFGNTGADAFSTIESIRNHGDSTCAGGIANRSSYWVPAMMTRDGQPLVPKQNLVYYKPTHVYRNLQENPYQVMPDGLKMVSGNVYADEIGENPNVSYICRNSRVLSTEHQQQNKTFPYIPQCAGGELEMIVHFQQCWDGVNLDSPDHQSHMSDPKRGECPTSHPVPLTRLTYKVRYDIPNDDQGSQGWYLSSDQYDRSQKPGGLSGHGDWFEGWEQTTKTMWLENCIHAKKNCGINRIGDGKKLNAPTSASA